ncbi:galactokinase [Xylanimonas allomyrinae]|uniref:Galactokinase n=1 Tax=Xylanimonas allomyrinae TaxID=2509459 RepID=A0A4P6ERM0_9MICO|nr:galactokinase family protein [Xylanimonas allomyrinae]QAY64563.1 galactokinase [Xylanimonas allomyrinae]
MQHELTWVPAWAPAEGADRARALFARTFGHEGPAAGAWSAPGRVNWIGEHTDYNAGLCLPIALPHRTFVALRPRADDLVRLVSANTDEPWEADLRDVAPGAVRGWGVYVAGAAWALRRAGHNVGGFDAAVDSCVPFGASLSSSAALESAVAVALDDVYGLGLASSPDGVTTLVAACVRAENEIAGAPTGGLDQSVVDSSRTGQALLLDFSIDLARPESATPVAFSLTAAGLSLLVIDTRAPHRLVDGQYAERRASCERAAQLFGVAALREITPDALDDALTGLTAQDPAGTLGRRVRHVVTETARTARFVDLERAGRYDEAGALMDASHASLRDDYQVTVRETDLAVTASRAAGAIGARMTDGGFGGSTIALVPTGEIDVVAVATAFADAGLTAPAFLTAPASAPAGRDA